MRYNEFGGEIAKKEKRSFLINQYNNEFDDMVSFIGCVEDVERLFGIEFACAVENGVPLFLSQSDEIIDKYDGEVIDTIFKYNGKVVDTSVNPCRFEFLYNADAHRDGSEEFTKPKIIITGKGSRS
jgi:hypothetical protein